MEAELTAGQDKRWVRRYARAIRILGMLIFAGAVSIVVVVGIAQKREGYDALQWLALLSMVAGVAGSVILGVVCFGLAQLLTYVLGERQRPGRLLRHGDKVLYVFAGLKLLEHMSRTIYVWRAVRHSVSWTYYLFNINGIVVVGAQLILLVALGLILRRIMPIVEESRTLV